MRVVSKGQVLSGWLVVGGSNGLAATLGDVDTNPGLRGRVIRVAGVNEAGEPVLEHDCHLRVTGPTFVVDYP